MVGSLKPFGDDTTALTIGGLTIENGTDRVRLSGSLDIAKDRQGLDHVQALQRLLADVVAALEVEADLPARATAPEPASVTRKKNPFT